MRSSIILLLVALLILPTTADARRRNASPTDSANSSVSAGCAAWGGESLEINATNDKSVFVVSLWGRGYQMLKMGGRSVSTDGVEGESGSGSGLVCAAGQATTGCQPQNLQVNFQSLDMQPGGLVSGTVSAGGDTANFQGAWPSAPAQCK